MADALLSAFVDQLTSAIFKIAESEVRLVKGAGDAIDSLKKNLGAIKAVLKDAERRQWENDAVKLWIDDLKDVSYDMDDVLDEWATAILISEIEKEESSADQNASFARKLKVQLSALCRCFHSGPLGRVRHRRGIARKIENLNARLDSIAARKDMFNFSTTSARIEQPIQSNTTTSTFVDVSKVFGQEAYKKKLIDRLLSEDGKDGGNLRIIPVVGMGGIGKTTLARIVYNDDEVISRFGKRLWVCVSDPFNIVKIANAIIEQLTGQVPSVVGLESLMQNLIASVKDEKFLLVLDDVWTDDYQKWEQLEKPLLACDCVGSRVLVTTRKVEVGRMMGVRDRMMVRVEELSEENCWLLFSEIAFFGRTNEERQELEQIGREVALKCNGLPLAAKTLGSLLRIKRTKEEWVGVLQSEIWRLETVKENVFYPLLLSYFDLSPTEKRCFSYCAIFPKDQLLEIKMLVQMWMAQGYFSSEKYEDDFMASERCFENLAMRSFFQEFEDIWEHNIKKCKMHDIVHDFAQFLTLNEHFMLNIDDIEEKLELSTRHMMLGVPTNYKCRTINMISISNKKNLHSLFFPGFGVIVDKNITDWCLRFKYLRTLFVEVSEIDIPESIGDLVHLRYLRLFRLSKDGEELKKLPCTLGNLCNLKFLLLGGYCLPQEVAKLINLRDLLCKVGDDDEVHYISLPKGIGTLRNLKEMSARLCSSTGNNIREKFELGDLANLNHLSALWLENVGIDEGHVEGAMRAQLYRKANLLSLVLAFDKPNNAKETSYELTHKSTLEALQPPPSLTYLVIIRYSAGDISPSWMLSSSIASALGNLKFLVLASCPNCESLPPLGKLQSLEKLKISHMERLKKVGPEFLGITSDMLEDQEECDNSTSSAQLKVITSFPRLKQLEFYVMPAWREWIGIQGWNKERAIVRTMPCLESLYVVDCKELEALPEFLDEITLKGLFIDDSPKLQEWLGSSDSDKEGQGTASPNHQD